MAFIIGIDAGHGLNTAGKRTPDGEREWSFNDKVADAFTTQINKYKDVVVKRYDDPTGKNDIPLATRTNKANADKCNVYISFHHNANTSKWGTWTGTEVWVYTTASGKSLGLAQKVAPIVANAYGLKNRGVKKGNLHIVRETTMPAILIEGGFMDSTIDIKKLRNGTVLANVGKAVADAVASYFGLKLKPVTTTTTTTTTKPATTTTTTATNGATNTYHTVVKGDTLYALAKKYNTTVAKIQAWNGMGTSTTLTVGKKLIVGQVAVTYHTVVKGDTLYALAKKYNTTVANIQKWNNMGTSTTLTVGKKLIVKK